MRLLVALLVLAIRLAASADADWKARRAELVTHLFGTNAGALPGLPLVP